MKWKINKNFQKCLSDAFDTFTDFLGDIENVDIDLLEDNFSSLVNDEDFEIKYLKAKDINFNTIHDYVLDDGDDLFYGVIVVVNCQGFDHIVLDGNHRLNTLKIKSPKTEVPVILIEF